ncbi:PREDICTED: cytochrome c oxidase subunit 5B, mitochondrial-like [Elephantulus edwardii]|uniref:cytochrome c oxidase subunit 5B, mitochondrial-like n=1 Tax=Elephantulus edwardii TaxID=28737 RepID=UPI0003F0F211|nr:PREDICTED: cytochrome c oxidase subunit 5B, mitochondrial-like [Elephantulus edwardii]
MASRLLYGAGALVAQALRACLMGSGGGGPTDDGQETGLEQKVMMAARKGQDPYNMLAPKAAKEYPNLIPSITNKRTVRCICEEDNSTVIWFWLHKGDGQQCPKCGILYKLVPTT